MKYGLPYKGSKNKLAERIVSLLPKRTHLIDLFCGGCAVTHAALQRGKYEHIHINDINWMCPTFFIDALNGKYKDETRWISRDDFAELKDKDPYVAFVWSFGNNLRTYLYGEDREDFKKALHYAIFFGDYTLAKDFGMDLSFLDNIDPKNYQKRYFAVKKYGRKIRITPPILLESAARQFSMGQIRRTALGWRTDACWNCPQPKDYTTRYSVQDGHAECHSNVPTTPTWQSSGGVKIALPPRSVTTKRSRYPKTA